MSVIPHTRSPVDTDVALEARHRWIELLPEAAHLAHAIANTDFVPRALRGNEAAIAATILYGDEVGLPPMQSLAKIAVIDGKPSLAAEAQRALIQAAGHSLRGEGTVTKFTWFGQRADNGDAMSFTWTLDDAKRAGIGGKQNWRTYPRAMLSARASAELARALFADVIGGLAATEELEDAAPAGDAEPEPPAPRKATSRRRRDTRANPPVIASTPPSAPDEPPPPPVTNDAPATRGPSEPAMKKLFALFNEHGLGDRLERLAWANARLERTITSASDLTDIEASILIQELEKLEELPAEDASPPSGEALGQTSLDTGGDPEEDRILDVRPATVEWLWWARSEAGVDDHWLREQLRRLGLRDVPARGRIGKDVLLGLSRAQARELEDELNSIIDRRSDDDEGA